MGIQAARSRPTTQPVHVVGGCTECKRSVFSNEKWVRVRRPTTGLNHVECVPAGAVLANG